MKLKTLAPAILAVLLGVAAAVLVRHSMLKGPPPQAVVTAPKMIPAVVATSDLIAGQQILAEDLDVTTVQSSTPPDLTLIGNPTELVGRIISTPVVKGQTLHQTNLQAPGAPASLISLVPAGMRAITIQVDEGNTFSGMLLPGCHVDVIASVASGKESLNRTLMNNILVQATGTRLTSARPEDGKEPPAFHTATLIVTLRQAQMIDLASQNARLRLVLRPLTHTDADQETNDTVTIAQILGSDGGPSGPALASITPATKPSTPVPAPVVATAAPSNKHDVTLILGNEISHVSVDMPAATNAQTDTAATDQKPVIDGVEPEQQ